MGVEDRIQRRVVTAAVRGRTGSRAGIGMLTNIELSVYWTGERAIDPARRAEKEEEERAVDLSSNPVNLRKHCLDLLCD